MYAIKCDVNDMKTINEIFNGKLLRTVGAVVAMMLTVPAFAATGNGCDKDSNDRINPEIALCSTHVYNIGEIANPNNENDKQLMKNVIALKTTVMTQEMYKQYEYLDATLRRFKTQLEKAVLTTKLQAAGADTSSAGSSSYSGISTSSSSYRNTDSNIKLAGAQNCMTTTTFQNAYSCLSSNIQLVLNAVNGGNNIGEARKQLEIDLAAAATWEVIYGEKGKYSTSDKTTSGLVNCNSLRSTRDSVTKCAQELNVAVARSLDKRQQQQNRQSYMQGQSSN